MNINGANAAMAQSPGDGAFSVFVKRVLSALVLIPITVAVVYLGGWWFAGAALFVAALALFEWYRLTGAKALWAATAALIAVWVASAYHQSVGLSAYIVIMGAVGSAFLCLVRGGEDLAKWAGAGFIYVCVPLIALLWLIRTPDGDMALIWLLVVIWTTDSGAFIAGRLIGGPKLAPTVSPGKTWAGAIGGVVAGVAASLIMAGRVLPLDMVDAGILAAAMSIVAQLGDLGESWVKRRFKAKDSGALIPGHGGVLDRIDSLVPTALVFAVVAAFYPAISGGAGQ